MGALGEVNKIRLCFRCRNSNPLEVGHHVWEINNEESPFSQSSWGRMEMWCRSRWAYRSHCLRNQ